MKNNWLRFYPILLLGVVFIAYGLLIPWLGFYLDDWYIVWFRHFFGSSAFMEFFGQDRPFLAWIYIILTPLLGDSPIVWQSFSILTKWILGMAVWDLLKQLWPDRPYSAALGALLYSVFPGFQFHWFSVQYGQGYLIKAGMFFSLACSIRAVRDSQRSLRWILIGWPLGVYGFLSVEYQFGLELLRPILIWLALNNHNLSILKRLLMVLKNWVPFFIPLAGFIIWRVFFFQSFMYEIKVLDEISYNPLITLWNLISTGVHEVFISLFAVWGNLFLPSSYSLVGKVLYVAIAVCFVALIAISGYLRWIQKGQANATRNTCWGLGAMLLGLIATSLTIIPFKAAGLPVNLDFPWNRFLIVVGFGSAIFAVGALSLPPWKWFQTLAASLLITLSIASQINSANQFRQAWEDQKQLLWQLSWRVPDLVPNTLLVTDNLRFAQYFSGTSLSAPLNWIYAPDLSSRQTPYHMVLLQSPQLDETHTISPNTPVNITYRSFSFLSNTNNSVFFVFNTKDCLQVLSADTNSRDTIINFHDPDFLASISLSNLSLIQSNPMRPATPPAAIFGGEPEHNWCYYYEKADLARQQGNWESVLDFYNQAEENGFSSHQDPEMYPKIEAFIMMDHWQAAHDLTKDLVENHQDLKTGLCALWNRGVQNNPPDGNNLKITSETIRYLQCSATDEEPYE